MRTATCMSLGKCILPAPSPCFPTLPHSFPPSVSRLCSRTCWLRRLCWEDGCRGVWPRYPRGAPSTWPCPGRKTAMRMHPGRPGASNTNCPAPSWAPRVPGAHLKCGQWDPPGQQAGLAGVMCLSSCSLSGRRSRDGTVVSWHGAHRRAWWEGMTLASISLCLGNRG